MTTEPEPQDSGMARLRRAFLQPSRGQVWVALLVGVLGFAAVTQVRARDAGDDYAGLRQADLVQALSGLNAASTRADQELRELEQTRDELKDSTQQRTAALEQARTELATLGILAGTSPAQGPGIVMDVAVGDEPLGINQLIDAIQELRDAGAEAIAINDTVRVVAQTAFEEGEDGGIMVGDRQLSAPYRIVAIGSPTTLDTAMQILGGFRDDVTTIGGTVDIAQRKNVRIDVVHTLSQPEFAEPVG